MGTVVSGWTFARHKHLRLNPPFLFYAGSPDFREEPKKSPA
jgi:hypothetical protein